MSGDVETTDGSLAPGQRCDFCNGPLDPDTAVAEEAGQWVCEGCQKKFEAELD